MKVVLRQELLKNGIYNSLVCLKFPGYVYCITQVMSNL